MNTDDKDIEIPRRLIVPTDNFYYTTTHEWVSLEEKNMVTVGITYFAQDQLGEIVSWKLPQKGQILERMHTFGLVESNKHVSDLYTPVSGEVVEVNGSLTPGLISDQPMSEGWLIRIEMIRENDLTHLMDPATYKKYIQKELDKLSE